MKKFLNNKRNFIICTICYIILSIILAILLEYRIHTPFEKTRFICVILGCSLMGSIFLKIASGGLKENIIKILKLLFSIILLIYVTYVYHKINIVMFGILELALITYISDYLISKNKIIGNIFGNILYLLFNANLCVYLFGSSYITLIMLQNLKSANELGGNGFKYITGIILVLVFSMLFYKSEKSFYKGEIIFIVIALGALILTARFDLNNIYLDYAPMGNYKILIDDTRTFLEIKKMMKNVKSDKSDFYHDGVENYYDKDSNLTEKPNVILIFAEGISSHGIYDSRNIMPNLREFSTKSISFDNYYNHHAATYRGIIGQLYSGYQYDNDETNYLISLHDVLKEEGYYSSFINIDVNTGTFRNYLKRMRFDEVYDIPGKTDGMVNSHSDKRAYEELFDLATEYNEKDEPFLLSLYTMGTHVSLNGVYQKFGDGKNSVLNRLYDMDYWFGEFIDKFDESELSENTIVIFTTDHASYVDRDYTDAFPKYKRDYNFLDKIPLFIYYKGIEPKYYDAKGRNSLDLTPTILDFLDISRENYFMGKSLFSDEGNGYDRIFYDGGPFLKIDSNGKFEKITTSSETKLYDVYNYFGVATKED